MMGPGRQGTIKEGDHMSGSQSAHGVVRAYETDEGDGARVTRLFPGRGMRDLDPFVLLDEFNLSPMGGFPNHAHRGFEAVTYMLEGEFHHRDTMGNDSVVSAGGVQRFTAGRGLVHSEMPGRGPRNRGLQLWVNLPRHLKRVEPSYQQVEPQSVPVRRVGTSIVRTIVGEGSPVRLRTPVRYLDISLEPIGMYLGSIPQDWRGLVYVLEGHVSLHGTEAWHGDSIELVPGETFTIMALNGPARLALLSGRPLGEPIIHNGTFVD